MTMDIIPLPDDRTARAAYLANRVKAAAQSIGEIAADGRVAVQEIYDGQYWRELGYHSFAACVEGEFGRSQATAYKWLAAATYERRGALPADSPNENTSRYPKHSQSESASDKPKQLTANRDRTPRQLLTPVPKGEPDDGVMHPHNRPSPIAAGVTGTLLPHRFPSGFVSCTIAADGRGYRLRLARRGVAIQDDWYDAPAGVLEALAHILEGG